MKRKSSYSITVVVFFPFEIASIFSLNKTGDFKFTVIDKFSALALPFVLKCKTEESTTLRTQER